MFCYYCGARLDSTDSCPQCEADVRMVKKIQAVSNYMYNEALVKVNVRDLSGAAEDLKTSLRYNKMNMNARNLLGLIYFEMGESVNAVSEWVISKSLIPDNNPAAKYLSTVQNNNSHLETLNQTIKKFNQALLYCRQGNYDLAVIQLKKVLSMNPKLVKANQLLALLYMKDGRYDQAKKCLKNAGRVDANNLKTLTYLKECNEQLKASGKNKKQEEKETVTYESGNDVIIRPSRFKDNTAVMSVVNLLVGAAIGIAVVCFLVIPGIRQSAKNDANSAVVKANETISTREQDIKSLEAEIESLKGQVEKANTASSSADDKVNAYESLLKAYVAYSDKDYEAAGTELDGVKSDYFSDDAKEIYDQVFGEAKDALLGDKYVSAVRDYTNKKYDEAITQFLEIVGTDETYKDGKAAYYLAHCYYQQKDGTNAMKWFKKVSESDVSSSSDKSSADRCISFMESHKDEYGLNDSQGTDDQTGTDTNE